MAENGQDSSDLLKNTAGSRPSSAKGGTLHWFAFVGPDPQIITAEDRESRIKHLKEKQNEERQKKLEEIKAQALAAQRFRERKELERRQRLDEMRVRDQDRRLQVEERKRMINEAERDRLESILKKNQERESRIELKRRNERSSNVFAFGSSTPRMLEPHDTGGSYWGYPRRATSTTNIMYNPAPLTRRQSERELDGGSKKRATSAGGLERSDEDMRLSTSMYEVFHWGAGDSYKSPIPSVLPTSRSASANLGITPQSPAGCASGHVGRRRTDLMPTIPSRDSRDSGSSSQLRKPFTKSPGRAYSMSRLDQLSKPRKRFTAAELSSLNESSPITTSSNSSKSPPRSRSVNAASSATSLSSSVSRTRSMTHLAAAVGGTHKKPLRKSDSRSMHQLSGTAPAASSGVFAPPPRPNRATQLRQQQQLQRKSCTNEAPSRPGSALSQQSTNSVASSVTMRSRPVAAPRRPRPISIAVTGITSAANNAVTDNVKDKTKPPLPKSRKSSFVKSQEKIIKGPNNIVSNSNSKSGKSLQSPTDTGTPKTVQSPTAILPPPLVVEEVKPTPSAPSHLDVVTKKATEEDVENVVKVENVETSDNLVDIEVVQETIEEAVKETVKEVEELVVEEQKSMKEIEGIIVNETSIPDVIQKFIDTEKEPILQEVLLPEVVPKPSIKETEQSNKVETETGDVEGEIDMTASMIAAKVRITTEEEAKAALAERRRIAREEAERSAREEAERIEAEARAEQERQEREEEQQRILVEMQRRAEQERLEEAIKEQQRREEEERLRREEEQRLKVLKEEADRRAREEADKQKAELQERLKNEEKEREARRKRVEAIMLRTRGKGDKGGNQGSMQNDTDKNEENKSETINGSKSESSENCHKNGKDLETVDNIIPVDSIKNANTVNVQVLNADDTINSNEATTNIWQRNATDLLM